MKIRIYKPETDAEKVYWIPTGFLFSKVGMYFMAKLTSSQARKKYEQQLSEMNRTGWDTDPDDLLSMEDVQKAERLTPPISEAQARELFTALKDSKYLLRGLPLISVESPDGTRTRIDL
jgi:hypothetical protein